MIDVKPEVLAALIASKTLTTLLGGPRIYQLIAPDPDEWPRITFFEMTNIDSAWADDTATASEIHLQIDAWSKGSTSALAAEVDKVMKSLGFKRTSGADLYEQDTGVFHKAMRYETERQI